MLQIVGIFVVAAMLFGIVHDQITARVCIEYFTIGHVTLVSSESPTVLGLVWGVVATWWAGALGGIVVSIAAREGRGPKLTWRNFIRPSLFLAVAMGVSAVLAGLAGYALTSRGTIQIVADYADAITPDRQARFMADVWAHAASYLTGAAGIVAIAVHTLRTRRGGRVTVL